MEKEEQIDIGKIWQIMKDRKKVCSAIIGGCTAISLLVAIVWPPTYESTTTVQTRVTGVGVSGAAAAAAALGLGSSMSSPTLSYVELMKSSTVLQPIIDELEWDEDEKEFLTPENFAKKNLKIENTKQTNLIKVTAKGKTPEEAQMISQHVVDNFLVLMTKMNKETQSLLVQFLDERIQDAKKEAEDARQKFATYQQEHKVYSPDEQAKAAVAKMTAFDDAIAKMEVQQKANQAKAEGIAGKLGDIKASSLQFNINDNENILGLRNKIVGKQLEIVTLRQQYTDENPAVVKAQEQLKQLQQSLDSEVNTIVASKYTTLNPTQAGLIQEQIGAQVAISVAKASEEAIAKRRDDEEKKLQNFPQDVLEYMNLQRDTAIKEGIYTDLVKRFEQNKIQQAMDSMDIQVVDPANLPFKEQPVWPKKKIIVLFGFVLGIMSSILYSIRMVKNRE
ncbi:GumC family protein [Selenomonas ruminantium]|uniref:Uncharacterized protein involved in exopolysaccharide biosynthesis n=1 Tax=Selenomonas ruminantium TaxID=971 RepID=A0A1H0TYF9_SELRU|nr:GumC family protein [Selenomonas ruminantium]SDP58795.1 Uncharacterized protein involved in exopolysaccharide biosynthesis [Selenomonas ruminantium]